MRLTVTTSWISPALDPGYAAHGGQSKLGEMNSDQLAKLQAFYAKQGISQTALPAEDLYTNEFVK
jgi:hypothetical protein